MKRTVIIRNGWDRLRYAVIFEGILVVSFGLILNAMTHRSLLDTGGLALALSAIALAVNLLYNYLFDRFDASRGRISSERSSRWRIVHAAGFECSLVFVSLPVIMWWLHWNFLQALLFDVVSMAAIVIYTYFFTLVYDNVFPVVQTGS